MIRIALIPFILVFLIPNSLTGGIPLQARLLTAGIIFGVAMLTDLFDGMIARKFDAVTNFGKFIDPIADKLLVICVMMAFVDMELISSIPVIIILAREFLVTGLRLAAAGKNVVVAANIWGKAKTMIQGIS
jgi:CDP-diacylglycerol--glycerol-3-phosphate 3-phosphatidyltransferase